MREAWLVLFIAILEVDAAGTYLYDLEDLQYIVTGGI